jgi:hypothetical protein
MLKSVFLNENEDENMYVWNLMLHFKFSTNVKNGIFKQFFIEIFKQLILPFHARYCNGYQDKCLFFVFLKVWGFLKVFFWTRMKMKICIFKTWSWRPCWILNFRYGIFYWIFKQFIRPLHAIFCYGYEDKCFFLFHLKFENA